MAAKILNIGSGNVETVNQTVIELSEPSIVQLEFGPEEVRTFDRLGNDLRIVLQNGEEVLLLDFFVESADGERSELVLVDDNGVVWWGQYESEWSGFYFAEVEDDFAAIPPWLWAGLAILGMGAAIAAGDSSDGGGAAAAPPPAVQ